MLEVLGDDYIAQHILYVLKRDAERKAWENYTADVLHAISNQLAVKYRFADLMKRSRNPRDEKTIPEMLSMIRGVK